MGAFAYCQKCDQPNGPPGLADCILRKWECRSCGEEMYADFEQVLREHVETLIDTMQLFNEELGRVYRLNGGIDPRDEEQWKGL